MRERLAGITQTLIKAGKEAGVIPYTQVEVEAIREAKRKAVEAEMGRRDRFRHMLLRHSDLECGSEREFLLVLSDRDPHPEHKITISECNHPEYQDKYGDNKTDLGWTPPNFRPEKLVA